MKILMHFCFLIFGSLNRVEIVPANGPPPAPTPPTPPTPTPPTPTTPTPTQPTPTPTPPTPTPPSPNPPTPGNGCCSQSYAECDVFWCGTTESECNNCGATVAWLPDGPDSNCLSKWSECLNNEDSCCAPSICVGNEWYKQCIDPPTPTPPSPTPPTPTPPSPTPPSPTPPSPTPGTPCGNGEVGNGFC